VQNGAVDLTVNGGTPSYLFKWSDGSNAEDISNVGDGAYTVTVTDSRDCTAQANFNISSDYELKLETTPLAYIKSGESIQLIASGNVDHGNTYSWSTAQNLICSSCNSVEVAPRENTIYTVNTTDVNGCTASNSISVEVNSADNIFVPNVFTPNNDGSNDVFELRGDMGGIIYLNFSVFNRWGEQVFETSDPHFKWDGVYKSEILQQGVYIYRMKIVFMSGNSLDNTGSITILR
jgi:gliding motility-associated-like protein